MESYDSFIERLASSSPAPGGGAASAFVSIVASSLNRMVASLTVGKKKYAEYQEEMDGILKESRKLEDELRNLMKEDEEAFNGIIEALRMPRGTDEEISNRKEKLLKASEVAIEVPWKIAATSRKVIDLSLRLAEHGNRNAITDAGCSALFAYSAVEGVLYNVKINLNSMRDEDYIRKQKEKIRLFLEDAGRIKSEVLKRVDESIGDV